MVKSIAGVLAFTIVMAPAAGAQTIRDARAGTVLQNATSVADPAMSYAVFLPPGYDSSRAWPIAFLMDPLFRSRAN